MIELNIRAEDKTLIFKLVCGSFPFVYLSRFNKTQINALCFLNSILDIIFDFAC